MIENSSCGALWLNLKLMVRTWVEAGTWNIVNLIKIDSLFDSTMAFYCLSSQNYTHDRYITNYWLNWSPKTGQPNFQTYMLTWLQSKYLILWQCLFDPSMNYMTIQMWRLNEHTTLSTIWISHKNVINLTLLLFTSFRVLQQRVVCWFLYLLCYIYVYSIT